MWFLTGLLGVVFGFILIIIGIYITIRIILKKYGFSHKSLSALYNEAMRNREVSEQKQRQLGGMTNVLLPIIRDDFENFSEKEFYHLVEKSLRSIFQAIGEKNNNKLLKDETFSLINDKIRLQIEDLTEAKKAYKYNDIIFHQHTIKNYTKKNGMINLEIDSSLEYYYEEYYEDSIIYKKDYKKQAKYSTAFIYIIDTKAAGFDINVLGLNCPNCGSPVSSLHQKNCKYCKTSLNIQVASLPKCWKIIDFKEISK